MSITDELREWANPFHDVWYDYKSDTYTFTTDGDGQPTMDSIRADTYILRIADRIDAEHQKALDEWKAEHDQMWLKGYAECHAELLEGNETIAYDLEGCGLIRLPKDADGEYIHVGDMLTDGECTFMAYELAVYGDGSWSIRNEDGIAWAACDVTHYHVPTVEDVLREFAANIADVLGGDDFKLDDNDELYAEFAKRLRLAEEVDE